MQTLEEKKALLQRAMDGKKHITFENGSSLWTVMYVGRDIVVFKNNKHGNEQCCQIKNCHNLQIVKPHITAEDLHLVIEDILVEWENERDDHRMEALVNKAGYLSQRYREQESKTANEVSEVGE